MMTPTIASQPQPFSNVRDLPAAEGDAAWKPLFRVGAIAALLSVAGIVAAIVVFLAWPPPATILGHFRLLHQNPLLGLLDLDLLMMATYALLVPIYLALYTVLRRAAPSLMLLALVTSLMSLALYLTTNPAFALLSLSAQYAGATTDTQRATLEAAGQAVYATSVGTAFDVSYVLGGVAALLIAAIMFRSTYFTRATAYVGLAMGILMLVPATAGTVGLVLSLVSLVPTMIWLVLVARQLFRFAAVSGRFDHGGSAPSV